MIKYEANKYQAIKIGLFVCILLLGALIVLIFYPPDFKKSSEHQLAASPLNPFSEETIESKTVRFNKNVENLEAREPTVPRNNAYAPKPILKKRYTGSYTMANEQVCDSAPIQTMNGMTYPTCEELCSKNSKCVAFNYDFSSGACRAFASCSERQPSRKHSQLFTKTH